ncbi:uncharacterized protein LOC130385452 [Gadus chalcogrammus]|uniref:uncharacterized protein LOC130385452 n=1 Tax=Gadus chalcogrammus TaxID=1042646 RepID=UPI0024C2EAC8|nr:uncharacterized protein LOC130385452 [Gadus chalcogrammus]
MFGLFTGSISDPELTERRGLLDLLEPGDGCMADKGFTIEKPLADRGATLIIPPFKMTGLKSLVLVKTYTFHKNSPDLRSSDTKNVRRTLEQVFDRVVLVDVLDSRARAHLSWLGRPELGVTFTKLHAWTLTRYHKCVFLDADTLVLQNVDELFQREELSAAPDPGWPDCFNTGVFVFRPSLETHARLLDQVRRHGSFDGGDQGLLNSVFSDWAVKDINRRLPFLYNLSISSVYTYLPAFQRYGHNARIIHFLGAFKPWHSGQGSEGPGSEGPGATGRDEFVTLWWREYLQQAAPVKHSTLSRSMHAMMVLLRVISMVVPDERGIQNTTPGNPGALLRTIPLPVDEVLVAPAAAPHIQEATNRPRWVVVNDPSLTERPLDLGGELGNTCLTRRSAVSLEEGSFGIAMKCAAFEKRSITVRMVVFPSDVDCIFRNKQAASMVDNQNRRPRKSKVRVIPGWQVSREECAKASTLDRAESGLNNRLGGPVKESSCCPCARRTADSTSQVRVAIRQVLGGVQARQGIRLDVLGAGTNSNSVSPELRTRAPEIPSGAKFSPSSSAPIHQQSSPEEEMGKPSDTVMEEEVTEKFSRTVAVTEATTEAETEAGTETKAEAMAETEAKMEIAMDATMKAETGAKKEAATEAKTEAEAKAPTEAEAVAAAPQQEQRQQWEAGRPDYLGQDAFHKIQWKLDRFLQ